MTTTVTLDEVWKLFKEADHRFQETERLMRENNAEIGYRMKETDRQMKETDRKIKDLAKQMGGLSNRWGEFVEGVVLPGCERIFVERGISIHHVFSRAKARLNDGRNMEIDILAVNSTVSILVEVKSKLLMDDVKQHLQRLAQFKDFFPRYADTRVMGAVAGIVSEKDAERFANDQGLFVIVQTGDTVCLANGEAFVPYIW